jgi:deoxycytidylate deaminase
MTTLLSKRHIQWYKNAQNIARNHDSEGRYSIAAVIAKGNRIFSVGYNYYPGRRAGRTFHPLYKGLGTHAEIVALSSGDCRHAILYIAGYSRFGKEICTKPCGRCVQMILNSTLKAVVYMDNCGELVFCRREDLEGEIKTLPTLCNSIY